MPRKKNTPLRLIVPLVVLLAGIGVAILAAQGGSKPSPTPTIPASSATDSPPGSPAGPDAAPPADPTQPAADPATEPEVTSPRPDAPAPAPADLRVRTHDAHPALPVLGSLDPGSDYEIEARLSPYGLGIESLRLTDYFETIAKKDHILVQATQDIRLAGGVSTAVPFALTAAIVNGQRIDLTSGPGGEPVWTNAADKGPADFEAIIETQGGEPVLRIERTIAIEPNSHDVEVRQRVVNLSEAPVDFSWVHTGPISPDADTGGYGGDKRRLRFGYWLKPESQAGDPAVLSDRYTRPFSSVVGIETENGLPRIPPSQDLWPNPASIDKGDRLVWIGLTDRYFGVAMHPLIDPEGPDRIFPVDRLTRVAGVDPATPVNAKRSVLAANGIVLVLAESHTVRIPPGGASSFDVGFFAGPLSRPVINAEPLLRALGLAGLVLYNFGGICAFCTFQPLAHLLLTILHFLHTATGDWAIGIIILVIIVRGVLHPVTRWSQIKMQRFGAQMQAIAPKQAKLKEKYGDDPKRMQQEMTKLWREEGINPAGMLGCLPMLLQSPVWIALYATLFFAVELRHEPAFYGVFQQLFGGWSFLADLSRSDNAIPLGPGFSLFGFVDIDAINILPIIMGLVFFFHQKYLTPPTTATLTPEQESQQKMIKVMMVVLFPLMMYAAPSGLALYFVTNSTLAIVENKWIRAHMNRHGLLDPDKIREAARARREAKKSGGFLARLQQAAAEQQKGQQASKRMMRRVKNTAPERTAPNYKKKKPRK